MIVHEESAVRRGRLARDQDIRRTAELEQDVPRRHETGRAGRGDMIGRPAHDRGSGAQAGLCRGLGAEGAQDFVRPDRGRHGRGGNSAERNEIGRDNARRKV